jgi:hypothetical protein
MLQINRHKSAATLQELAYIPRLSHSFPQVIVKYTGGKNQGMRNTNYKRTGIGNHEGKNTQLFR